MNKLDSVFRWFLAILIISIAILATIVSTSLTIYSFYRIITVVESLFVIILFFVLIQSMVLLGELAKSYVYNYCPQHYRLITTFTNIAFILSVLSTATYFNSINKADRAALLGELLNLFPFISGSFEVWLIDILTNMTLIWLACIMLDLMAMKFPALGIDLIRKTKITEIAERSTLGKLIYVAFSIPSRKIDYWYENTKLKNKNGKISHENSHEILHKENDDFFANSHEINDLKSHKNNTTKSHENNSCENSIKRHVITGLESCEKNEISNENSMAKSHEINDSKLFKTESNSNKNSHEINTPKLFKTKLKSHEINSEKSHENNKTQRRKRSPTKKDIVEKIQKYIDKEYNSGEKINVGDLRKNLKIGEYDWRINREKLMKKGKLKVDNSDTYVA